jgi:hypothetical protein
MSEATKKSSLPTRNDFDQMRSRHVETNPRINPDDANAANSAREETPKHAGVAPPVADLVLIRNMLAAH